MKKRKMYVTIGIGLACVAAVTVLILALRPPLSYYTNFKWGRHSLPTRLVRAAIRFASGHDAPAVMEDAQGIISGGREPCFFLRFRTDDSGLQYVLEQFGGRDAPVEVTGEETLRFGRLRFDMAVRWQNELGVTIFDPSTIHSGMMLTHYSGSFDPAYTVLIDDRQHTVYILARPYS